MRKSLPSSLFSMSKKDYCWKRFWSPRSGNINLADGGYLFDPDAEWGKAYNPDLVNLEAIADIPCLVLLGEPGIGKSRELDNLKVFTEKKICRSSQVLELNFRSCTNLKEDLFKDETFIDWLEGSYHLYLFLDSLDEGLLSIPTLATGLIDELKKPKYQNHINRLHLRLACRTFVFPEILEEGLKELWKEDCFGIYELAPLRRIDVVEAAKAENFSPDAFLKELDQKEVVPLAIKPITLRFLLNTYRSHQGQFPPNQKLHELYLEGCKLLCEEVSESRQASNRVGNLDNDQRLIVAARIAAFTIFTNRFAVWTGVDQGDVPAEDVLLKKLCFGYEKVNGRKFEVSRKIIKEVLDTGLFSSRGSHRMGWAHQTYTEFLAAWYLIQCNLNLPRILNLILHPDGRIIPQLQETTAWLASMRLDVFHKVIETDPDVLLKSELASTSEADKVALVETLLELHDQEKLPYNYYSTWSYKKLDHSTLPEQLKKFICDRHKSINARNVAIDIAEACGLVELSASLADLALDGQESNQVRLNAAIAICEIGSEEAKSKLKPLALLNSSNGFEDELKGCGLRAVWPQHITIEEAFNTLSSPKSGVIGGRYQDFVAQEFGRNLKPKHLLSALQWLENQPSKRFSRYPFGYLADDIMRTAWEYLEDSQILKSFSRIVFKRLKNHQKIIDADSIGEGKEFRQLLEIGSNKRLKIAEEIISIFANEKEDLSYFTYSNSGIISEQDFSWLIGKLKSASSESLQQAWAKLIRATYKEDDFDHVNTILEEWSKNSALESKFSNRIHAIEINSPEAQQARERQARLTERQRREYLEPPPKERVLNALSRFESGQIDAWCHLCHELTLLPMSIRYGNLYNSDLTDLPGWKEANEDTKIRCIKAAKNYAVHGNPKTEKWLGTKSYCYSALAGYKALQLLLKTNPEFCNQFSTQVWQKWTPIILAYPLPGNKGDWQYHWELCQRAYKNAPSEFLNVLGLLMDKENTEDGQIRITRYIRSCWDNDLAQYILNKLSDATLTAKSIEVLLEDLLQYRSQEAKVFAESLITSSHSTTAEAREKAVVAACALILHTEDAGWETVWPAIQNNHEFGQQVLKSVSFEAERKGHVDQRLNENSLADLYIFLMKKYPDEEAREVNSPEDEEVLDPESYVVGPKDSIRLWRNGIPKRLQERGTQEACDALRKIIHELPELKDQLHWRLLEAESLTRRKTWQPLSPEEFLQFVISQEPSNLDLSNQIDVIDQRTKKMEDEPKIENKITISHSPNSPINAPVGTSGVTNSNVTISSSDGKKGINWGNWLAVIGILVAIVAIPLSMSVSGAFNEEFKQWFNRIFPSKVEQQSAPSSK